MVRGRDEPRRDALAAAISRRSRSIKDDKDVTAEDIRDSNLILWGDASSNSILKEIADSLPIAWKEGKIVVGEESFDAATHVPVLIYLDPAQPQEVVELNSGFTFREYDYLNNSRQMPKLPDFAIVDMTTPPNGAPSWKDRHSGVLR